MIKACSRQQNYPNTWDNSRKSLLSNQWYEINISQVMTLMLYTFYNKHEVIQISRQMREKSHVLLQVLEKFCYQLYHILPCISQIMRQCFKFFSHILLPAIPTVINSITFFGLQSLRNHKFSNSFLLSFLLWLFEVSPVLVI